MKTYTSTIPTSPILKEIMLDRANREKVINAIISRTPVTINHNGKNYTIK
jgi:hypothetical protein